MRSEEVMPVARESRWAELLRRSYRVYRDSRLCVGHGAVRRLFRGLIARHQLITLGNGLRLELDLDREVQSSIFWFDGRLEPQLEWVIRELLPVGGTCVDCGANCGLIGLLALRLRRAHVVMIEPHPRLAASIRRNLELNGWQGTAEVIEMAASDACGSATLFENSRKDGSHSLLSDWEEGNLRRREIVVRSGSLESVLDGRPGFSQVDLLKIDTEGHDFAVLRGLGKWLEPGRVRVIYTELGREREDAALLLGRAGYQGFAYRPLGRKPMDRLMKRWRAGVPVGLFLPITAGRLPEVETLWVASGSAAARYLEELAVGTCR